MCSPIFLKKIQLTPKIIWQLIAPATASRRVPASFKKPERMLLLGGRRSLDQFQSQLESLNMTIFKVEAQSDWCQR